VANGGDGGDAGLSGATGGAGGVATATGTGAVANNGTPGADT